MGKKAFWLIHFWSVQELEYNSLHLCLYLDLLRKFLSVNVDSIFHFRAEMLSTSFYQNNSLTRHTNLNVYPPPTPHPHAIAPVYLLPRLCTSYFICCQTSGCTLHPHPPPPFQLMSQTIHCPPPPLNSPLPSEAMSGWAVTVFLDGWVHCPWGRRGNSLPLVCWHTLMSADTCVTHWCLLTHVSHSDVQQAVIQTVSSWLALPSCWGWWLHVCVCVCVRARMCVCMHVCAYVSMHY